MSAIASSTAMPVTQISIARGENRSAAIGITPPMRNEIIEAKAADQGLVTFSGSMPSSARACTESAFLFAHLPCDFGSDRRLYASLLEQAGQIVQLALGVAGELDLFAFEFRFLKIALGRNRDIF